MVGWFSDPFCFLNLSSTFPWKGGCPSVDSPASGGNVGSAVTENWMKIEFSSHLPCSTLQGTNISPQNGILKMVFLFPRWDMLIPWRVAIFHFIFQYISYFHRSRISIFVKFPGYLGRNKTHGIGYTISHTRDKCRKWDNAIYDVLGYLIMIDLHVWYFALHFKQVQLFLLFSTINFGVWQFRSSLNFSGWSSIPNIFNRTRTNMKKHDGTIP